MFPECPLCAYMSSAHPNSTQCHARVQQRSHVEWLNEHTIQTKPHQHQPEHNFSTFVQPPKGEHLNIHTDRIRRRKYVPINDTSRERLSI